MKSGKFRFICVENCKCGRKNSIAKNDQFTLVLFLAPYMKNRKIISVCFSHALATSRDLGSYYLFLL